MTRKELKMDIRAKELRRERRAEGRRSAKNIGDEDMSNNAISTAAAVDSSKS